MIPMKKDQRLLVDDNKEGVNELTTSRKKSFLWRDIIKMKERAMRLRWIEI